MSSDDGCGLAGRLDEFWGRLVEVKQQLDGIDINPGETFTERLEDTREIYGRLMDNLRERVSEVEENLCKDVTWLRGYTDDHVENLVKRLDPLEADTQELNRMFCGLRDRVKALEAPVHGKPAVPDPDWVAIHADPSEFLYEIDRLRKENAALRAELAIWIEAYK